MARVLIEVSERLRLRAVDEAALASSLGKLGWGAEVRGMVQRRDAGAAVDIALRVLESVEEHALDALVGAAVGAIVARLKQPGSDADHETTVAVFGPNGEELRRIAVPLGREHETPSGD